MIATFYDVKMREKVDVEVDGKIVFEVRGQARYALRAKTSDGRKLTKFVSKEIFDEAVDVPEVKPEPKAPKAKKAK